MQNWSFTEHPESVGETYSQHFMHSASFGMTMLAAGCACLMHGLLPFLFQRTGSRAVMRLHDRMVVNRRRTEAPAASNDAYSFSI